MLDRGGARKAILFGSYARGDADEYSDEDLIIIAQTQRPFVERFKYYSELWEVSPVKVIEVVIYTPEEFETMQVQANPFVNSALSEGITIYEAGP